MYQNVLNISEYLFIIIFDQIGAHISKGVFQRNQITFPMCYIIPLLHDNNSQHIVLENEANSPNISKRNNTNKISLKLR